MTGAGPERGLAGSSGCLGPVVSCFHLNRYHHNFYCATAFFLLLDANDNSL